MSKEAACENQNSINDEAEVVSLTTAKLIKLKNQIKKLRNEALEGYTKEMQGCKLAFSEINNLIGELNESAGGEK
jgi:hypothetical protein